MKLFDKISDGWKVLQKNTDDVMQEVDKGIIKGKNKLFKNKKDKIPITEMEQKDLTPFIRWRLIQFHDYVILKTLDWDREMPGIFHLDVKLIPKSELPKEAVHVTGERNTYAIDNIKIRYGRHDDGFGALDAYLYMENNSINKALALKWSEWNHIDMKRVIIIVGGLILAVCVGWLVLRGGR